LPQPKRILVTGANGLLGQKITDIFSRESDHELVLTDLQPEAEAPKSYEYFRQDITKKDELKERFRKHNPEVVINTAAYTNVDGCESDRELCWRINVDAVKNLIIASKMVSAKLIHFTSDYVFDGKNGNYDESSTPNPVDFYGRAKLASENAIIASGARYAIVRTQVLYGTGKNVRPNFALWLLGQLKKNEPVKIVDDQLGQPTVVDDVAFAVLQIVDRDCTGIYHVCGSEFLSRYKFALKLADIFEFDKNLITPVKTAELNQLAERPMNSSFITLKAESELGIKPLNVTDGLYFLKQQLGL
jgi:dTDP-4-dehydrorhamnose reductase